MMLRDLLRCDRVGCKLPAFFEIHYGEELPRWSQVCPAHFILLRDIIKGWSLAEWLYRIPLVLKLWNLWAR